MNVINSTTGLFEEQLRLWEEEYEAQIGAARTITNRSGIEVKPLYSPDDWNSALYQRDLGFPGRAPYTRGIYPTMHRGRTWSQRQLIGLGFPEDYNARIRALLDLGVNAVSFIPCNSGFRGYDCDEVPVPLLGTCGTVMNTTEHMARCLDGVPIETTSVALNDPSPFTFLAFLVALAEQRGLSANCLQGTSNQSDYLSHCVANHMFFRLSLPGARRVLIDHIEYCATKLPAWNPLSVVGQHMQQAGATPAQAMGFALSSAVQYAEDCVARGMEIDRILPRFTFFFDISISFFEEIAKFRAGRRIWARLAKERLGAKDPRSLRFKFHAQTSGVDLTRQQPLNNIARVAIQAMAGIFGGLQSMHTDAFDEALSSPSEEAARIAVATQNILREEAHLCDVIDPLGGSYYIETLTNEMEAEIEKTIAMVDQAGGMYRAVESGIVQREIGRSSLIQQRKIETGAEKVVGVNCYQSETEDFPLPPIERPDPEAARAFVARFKEFKAARDQAQLGRAIDAVARAAESTDQNVYAAICAAAAAGATHGEITGCLRKVLGFGQPVIVV